jgi:ankyrin repeat protein
LLEKVIDIEAKDLCKRTALRLAAENGHDLVILLLLKNGADVEAWDSLSWRPTALHLAAANSHKVVARQLLD